MKFLSYMLIIGFVGYLCLTATHENNAPSALANALRVLPPVQLEYEAKRTFGLLEYLIITNTSDRTVTPTSIMATTAEGVKYMIDTPEPIKPHQMVKIRMSIKGVIFDSNIVFKVGDKIEVYCSDYPMPRSLSFVKETPSKPK